VQGIFAVPLLKVGYRLYCLLRLQRSADIAQSTARLRDKLRERLHISPSLSWSAVVQTLLLQAAQQLTTDRFVSEE
jgi:hypothetical protein